MKNLCYSGGSSKQYKNKNCCYFEILMNQIYRQMFIIFENWVIVVEYCWKYSRVEVAPSFH